MRSPTTTCTRRNPVLATTSSSLQNSSASVSKFKGWLDIIETLVFNDYTSLVFQVNTIRLHKWALCCRRISKSRFQRSSTENPSKNKNGADLRVDRCRQRNNAVNSHSISVRSFLKTFDMSKCTISRTVHEDTCTLRNVIVGRMLREDNKTKTSDRSPPLISL